MFLYSSVLWWVGLLECLQHYRLTWISPTVNARFAINNTSSIQILLTLVFGFVFFSYLSQRFSTRVSNYDIYVAKLQSFPKKRITPVRFMLVSLLVLCVNYCFLFHSIFRTIVFLCVKLLCFCSNWFFTVPISMTTTPFFFSFWFSDFHSWNFLLHPYF